MTAPPTTDTRAQAVLDRLLQDPALTLALTALLLKAQIAAPWHEYRDGATVLYIRRGPGGVRVATVHYGESYCEWVIGDGPQGHRTTSLRAAIHAADSDRLDHGWTLIDPKPLVASPWRGPTRGNGAEPEVWYRTDAEGQEVASVSLDPTGTGDLGPCFIVQVRGQTLNQALVPSNDEGRDKARAQALADQALRAQGYLLPP